MTVVAGIPPRAVSSTPQDGLEVENLEVLAW